MRQAIDDEFLKSPRRKAFVIPAKTGIQSFLYFLDSHIRRDMEFVPAGEIIGKQHQVRTVGLKQSPHLSDGDYTFVDTYCIDASCDCRRTLIQVLHNGVHVSTIGFGWESPIFYKNWMGDTSDEGNMPQLHGATIDISSPNKVPAQSMIGFFVALLDEKWINTFKRNYAAVKKKLKPQKKKKK